MCSAVGVYEIYSVVRNIQGLFIAAGVAGRTVGEFLVDCREIRIVSYAADFFSHNSLPVRISSTLKILS